MLRAHQATRLQGRAICMKCCVNFAFPAYMGDVRFSVLAAPAVALCAPCVERASRFGLSSGAACDCFAVGVWCAESFGFQRFTAIVR